MASVRLQCALGASYLLSPIRKKPVVGGLRKKPVVAIAKHVLRYTNSSTFFCPVESDSERFMLDSDRFPTSPRISPPDPTFVRQPTSGVIH